MSEIMRQRSRGSLIPGQPVDIIVKNGPGACGLNTWAPYNPYTPLQSCMVGTLESMSDVVVPRFKRQSRSGKFFFNSMSHEKVISAIDQVGHGYQRHGIGPNCNIGGVNFFEDVAFEGPQLAYFVNGGNGSIPIASPVAIIDEDDIRRLVIEVATKVRAERGSGNQNNLFESLAESRKTLAMFSGPIRYLFSFFKKNGKRMKMMGPAEAWLAYRYGLKPFVSDVTTIIDGLAKPVGVRRETSRDSKNIRETEESSFTCGDSVATVTVSKLTTDTVIVRGMAIDEHVANLRDNLGLSTKNLFTVPWELIPFSFVLDWFVSAGDFLKAYAPTPGFKTIGSCITTERTTSALYTAIATTATGLPGYSIVRPVSGACSSTIWSKVRGQLAQPGIVIRSNFRFSSLTRTADALALLSVVAQSFFSGGGASSGISIGSKITGLK